MILMLILSSSAVYATGEIKIFVDNVELKTDVPPVIINNNTMVPVRVIAEAVDCDVQWDQEQKMISIGAPCLVQPLMHM